MIGVYKITNIINGKVYIGESMNIEGRWNEHRDDLKSGNHHSYKLQEDYNTYGEDNFKFEVLEEIDVNNLELMMHKCLLIILENKYIKKFNSIVNGYNIEDTLDLILKGEKPLFDGYKINGRLKYILNNIIKNINKNNGIFIPKEKSKPKHKEIRFKLKEQYVTEETKIIQNKPKLESNNKSKKIINFNNLYGKYNIEFIITNCKNYIFKNEYEKLSNVFQENGFNNKTTYQILRDINIIGNDKNNKNGNIILINDLSMFKNEENYLKNTKGEIDKIYFVPYMTRKGFKYLLKNILEYAKNNNINVFTQKFTKENLTNI